MKELRVLFYILYAVAAPLIAGGSFWAANSAAVVLDGTKTKGVIVEAISMRKSLPHLVVSFAGPDGHQFSFKTSGISRSHERGESLEIIYKTSNPEIAFINSFSALWLHQLQIIIMGLVALGMGAYLHFYHTKLLRKEVGD